MPSGRQEPPSRGRQAENSATQARPDGSGRGRSARDPLQRHALTDRLAGPALAGARPIQRVKYLELSDSNRELVDTVSHEAFEGASEHFEQQLGLVACQDLRSATTAHTLLTRTLTLAEEVEATKEEVDRKDRAALTVELFGIERRQDISGYVQPSPEMLLDVFKGGTVREKMGLFYVAMAEKQTLGKLFNRAIELQHEAGLNKGGGGTGGTGGTTSTSLSVKPPKVSAYATDRMEKEHFRRAMEWVLQDIELARKSIEKTLYKTPPPKLDREQEEERRREDEEMAIKVINIVTGGTVVGDETKDAKKLEKFAFLTRAVMFSREARVQKPGDITEQDKQIELFNLEHQKLMGEYKQHAAVFSAGYGKLKFLMEAVFANAEPAFNEVALDRGAKEDLEPDVIKAFVKKDATDAAWKAVGETIRNKTGGFLSDAELNLELEKALAEKIGDGLDDAIKRLKKEVKDAEGGKAKDRTTERIAERRFNMNFLGPSLLGTKALLENSRAGSSRTMAPEKSQRSTVTANELDKDVGDEANPNRLTWRELGSAFYSKSDLDLRLAKFRSENALGPTDAIKGDNAEKLRKELLAEHGNKTLPWKPGVQFWKLDPKSALVQASQTLRVRVGAAMSGTTDRVLRSARLLGLSGKELQDVLVTCLGWMLPARDHTYFEIMKAAEAYVGLSPPETPFSDTIIDADYAQGHGYRKALALFPWMDPRALPDYLLSLAYKDAITEKLKLKAPDTPETTLRILSSREGDSVVVGQEVQYTIRQPPKEKMTKAPRFEWYFLRHEGGQARGEPLGEGDEVTKAWGYKGLYKLYVLVHHDDEQSGGLPAATLRFDQLVFSSDGLEGSREQSTGGSSKTDKVDEGLALRATFTTWDGTRTEIPLTWSGVDVEGGALGMLKAPRSLDTKVKDLDVYWGGANKSKLIDGGKRTGALFNRLHRKAEDPRTLRVRAAFEALKQWELGQKYDGTGSVNVDIIDPKTGVVMREHFFTVDRGGDKLIEPEKLGVPSFRTQGGDFISGIKSSVRLVNTWDGRLEVSGDAMVWVNFGDKARLVWWLNNRTDRAYSVGFKVEGSFLKHVAKDAVPESESNAKSGGIKLNEGKPIISQDKATHQYAINRDNGKGYGSLESMKKAAGKHFVKIFQWKTFDLEAPSQLGLSPKTKGSLAYPFNEKLKAARDLDVKVRLLEAMGGETEEIEKLRQKATQLEQEGMRQWRMDFNTNLRKPGEGELSTSDRRQPTELDERELAGRARFFAGKVRDALTKKLSSKVGPITGKMIGVLIKVENSKTSKKLKWADAKALHREEARQHTASLKEALKISVEDRAGLIGSLLPGLPEVFQQRVWAFGHNLYVQGIFAGLTSHKSLKLKWKLDVIPKELIDTTNAESEFETTPDLLSEPPSTTGGSGGDSTGPSTSLTGISGSLGKIVTKPTIDFEKISTGVEAFNTVKTDLELGGIAQAGNSCYLASVLQLMAISPHYTRLFNDLNLNGVDGDRRQVVLGVRAMLGAINRGETVSGAAVQRLREHLVGAGWRMGQQEALASQEDAAELLRFFMEEIVRSPVGFQEDHRWGRANQDPNSATERSGLLAIGGLGNVDQGRELVDMLTEHYRDPSVERDRGGDITHTRRLTAMPDEFSMEVRRYDFLLSMGTYVPRTERIGIGPTLAIPGAVTPNRRGYVYALRGFVVHQGISPRGGHYVAYVLRGGQWYMASDSVVRTASLEEVAQARAGAYIYHYSLSHTVIEPLVIPRYSIEELQLARVRVDPNYERVMMIQAIVQHRDEPEWIHDLLLLSGPGKRRELRMLLTGATGLDEDLDRLRRSVLEIMDNLERELSRRH